MVSASLLLALLLGANSAVVATTASKPQARSSRPTKRAAAKQRKATAKPRPATAASRLKLQRESEAATAPPPDKWFMAQRAYPSGTIPDDAITKAMLQRRALERQYGAQVDTGSLDAATSWSSLGPSTINSPEGTATGRVTAIATDSRNPDTLYIGAAGGGVWRSTDGGATWQSLGDNLLSLVSGSLVLDERTGMLYYGTGDHGAGTYGAGLLRSPDGVAPPGWT